jgi:hypothetical protein
VFPARYELNSYIVFRKRLVSKRLIVSVVRASNLTLQPLTRMQCLNPLGGAYETVNSIWYTGFICVCIATIPVPGCQIH